MPQNKSIRTSGSFLLAIMFFILVSAPRLNIKFGPAPIYFVDILIFFVFIKAVHAGRLRRKIAYPFQKTVLIIIPFAMMGEILAIGYAEQIIEPVYISVRSLLAFSLVFSVPILIQTEDDVKLVLKAAMGGLLITSILMIATSLPFTRLFVTRNIFSYSFLEPASGQVVRNFLAISDEVGVRGRTLVGVSIMGATFINMTWPMAIVLLKGRVKLSVFGKFLAYSACMLAPIAVVMSYSRGPIIGTILMILVVLTMGLRKVRRGILFPIALSAVVFLTVGIGSQLFNFDRLIFRTQAVFNDPYAADNESERIMAYIEPFGHVLEKPHFLIFGEGNAILKTNVKAEQDGKANHAMFAKAYYSYGMVTAFIYMYLLFQMLFYSYKHYRYQHVGLPTGFNQAMFLTVVAFLPWAAFGHAMVSTPRGAMLMFFTLGMLASLRNFLPENSTVKKI